jgi:hypothetical protein
MGGILSVKPACVITPGTGPCAGGACPGASGFTPGLAQINGVPANSVALGQSSYPANDVAPGIVAHAPQ